MIARKYRTKPVVIEAVHWSGEPAAIADIIEWIRQTADRAVSYRPASRTFAGSAIAIDAPNGTVAYARAGDWIIRGPLGRHYLCRPDIFDATYEPVELGGAE